MQRSLLSNALPITLRVSAYRTNSLVSRNRSPGFVRFVAFMGFFFLFPQNSTLTPSDPQQIYNWFKNTVGRTRRKLDGRPRSGKKAAEKGENAASPQQADLSPWNPAAVVASPVHPYSEPTANPVNTVTTTVASVQYAALQTSTTLSPLHPRPAPHTVNHGLNLTIINQSTLREAFLQGIDSSTLTGMIQTLVISSPSPMPLTPVVEALFEAISTDSTQNPFSRDPHAYLRRFLDASTYFPSSVVHAGVSGPLAGPRALQMQIRKFSTWIPHATTRSAATAAQSGSSSSITDEMQRIAGDRQRRKDHIQWARIHAAALELGMLGMGYAGDTDNSGYAYAMGRAFSEMMARDAVWEADEVEWVAGICVLRAVIRTAMRGDRRQRDEYDELLRTYERRWKEIKDEARQALVTDVLLAANEDLARLDESLA
ncbi:hypothetical protein L208DRAFT_713912 [Tricholoma matsutake]|nr:hypothetical protein L208DRAFT_713912 [Tricholoma matsutake 945]